MLMFLCFKRLWDWSMGSLRQKYVLEILWCYNHQLWLSHSLVGFFIELFSWVLQLQSCCICFPSLICICYKSDVKKIKVPGIQRGWKLIDMWDHFNDIVFLRWYSQLLIHNKTMHYCLLVPIKSPTCNFALGLRRFQCSNVASLSKPV